MKTIIFKIVYCLLTMQLGVLIIFGMSIPLMIALYITTGVLFLSGILIVLNDQR